MFRVLVFFLNVRDLRVYRLCEHFVGGHGVPELVFVYFSTGISLMGLLGV